MTNESPFRKNRAFYIGVVLTVLEGILSGCSYLSVYIVLTALASGTITAGMVGAVTAGLAVIFLLRLVIYSTGYTQVQIGGAAVSKRLRLLLGDKLKKIPLARFTQGQVGQYVNTMTSDVGSYEKILTHSSGNIIKNAALSAVLVGFVCTVWLPAGLILLAVVALLIPDLWLSFRVVKVYGVAKNKVSAETVSGIVEYIDGIQMFRAYNMGGVKKQDRHPGHGGVQPGVLPVRSQGNPHRIRLQYHQLGQRAAHHDAGRRAMGGGNAERRGLSDAVHASHSADQTHRQHCH